MNEGDMYSVPLLALFDWFVMMGVLFLVAWVQR
jgi:hypothetical protein